MKICLSGLGRAGSQIARYLLGRNDIQIVAACCRPGSCKQGKDLGISFKRDSNHPFRHQEKNTECGMYCLYFIIELLTNNKEISYFKNNKIADHCMEKMRKVYFN